ncbi:c-type cytochrome [Nitratireductor thuwali]|uniref:Cytochrome c n=1 Tax=Nitratireductor thuwali TaxID=2267699 RepID=A0ABY5MP83_9HYPH|nr:Cytochrome c' [Nitratireductor thuwali]
MKSILLSISALMISVAGVAAADDPVAVRKALMQASAASAAASGGMMKGEIAYNPAVAKAAIATLNAVSHAYGDFFPEGTGGEDTSASPKIWEDGDAWQQALSKFQTDTQAAVEAAGKDGPADLAAFQAAIGPVLSNCRSCHETFRLQTN